MADTVVNHKLYPYKFDSTDMPFMASWNEDFGRIVNSKMSEAGDDIETVVRRGKLKVSAQCNGFSSLKKTIEQFYYLDSFVLSRYDDVEEGYVTYNVRMTSFAADRMYQSEGINDTVGLWKISFTLEEF